MAKQSKLSPENYIRTKARNLPLGNCYINANWQSFGMATIIVIRKHTNGNFTVGVYLVDTFARGTKDTFYRFNIDKQSLDEIIDGTGSQLTIADYVLVHNIIYGANNFAEEHDFKISKEFRTTQYILEEDDDNIELIEFEFGQNGEPLIIDSPY